MPLVIHLDPLIALIRLLNEIAGGRQGRRRTGSAQKQHYDFSLLGARFVRKKHEISSILLNDAII